MTTPRIEEMVEEFLEKFGGNWHSPVQIWLSEALTQAQQAGIDDAVEIVRSVKPTGLPDAYSESDDIISRDDTIKALQDNK